MARNKLHPIPHPPRTPLPGNMLTVDGGDEDARPGAPGVKRALTAIRREKEGAGAAAGEAWMARLAAENRYVLDAWASS